MRALALVLMVAGTGRAADLPLFFNSGSDFTGTISRHSIQGDAGLEARFSRVGEKVTLRMLTVSGKAVVLMVQKAGTDKALVNNYQIDNGDGIFRAAQTALDEKARQWDAAERARHPFFRSSVYQAREYPNKDLTVAAHQLAGVVNLPDAKVPVATVIVSPVDKDTVQGEVLVYGPNRIIQETIWFEAAREVPVTPAAPAPPPAPTEPLPPPPKAQPLEDLPAIRR